MNDYESMYSSFSWPRPKYFNFTEDVIDTWASSDAEKEAIVWTDDENGRKVVTFRALSDISRSLASQLHGAGIRHSDTVIVILGRQLEWWESITACLRGGFVASPATTQLSARDIEHRVNAASAAAVITDSAGARKVDEIAQYCPGLRVKVLVGDRREGWQNYRDWVDKGDLDFATVRTRLDDPAVCFFTSGTTGKPKIVMHSHGYGLAHNVTGEFWLGLTPDDLHWNISDTGWAKAAWSSYFGPWNRGAAIFVDHSVTFRAERVLKQLQSFPITTMCGAPTIYRMLVLQDLKNYRFPRLRDCVSAGEPLNPEVIETWREATGITIRDGYGQTESVILCGTFPVMTAKPGSMGKPAPGFDLQIIDDDLNILPSGKEGDIAVRTEPEHPLGLFHGYDADSTDGGGCFRDGWYLSGDRGYRDDDGYFWFVGRADDVIISAGYRIGPFEVESALLEHPQVAESAVVASPDAVRGEVVKAFVVLTDDGNASETLVKELQEHVKSTTAPYKYPRKIEFVSELPKTVSGKIRRVDLRQREQQKTEDSTEFVQ